MWRLTFGSFNQELHVYKLILIKAGENLNYIAVIFSTILLSSTIIAVALAIYSVKSTILPGAKYFTLIAPYGMDYSAILLSLLPFFIC
ncbi:hypothetical protein Ctaglu_12960 [Clostridium tagluense]|uniref:Uncharacterized protein n=1 Tax=Clostridium tagluense TaxID=360422 RepID=A0A401UJD3_9CLOT|nr:hypothetical protein Ctaglu_12960 [Clostridium tagluense]